MKKLVLFGAKAFAELAHFYFTHDSPYLVAAFTVNGQYLQETSFKGLPVVPFEELAMDFPPPEFELFVAVGMHQVNQQRADKVAEAEAKGYRLASFISSKAHVSADLVAPPNSMVMEHAALHPFVRIGRDTIIWGGTRIALHSVVGDHCWITCATLGESVVVGDFTFVGLNATIAPNVRVGSRNVIGAGALILRDTSDAAVYRGAESKPSKVPSNRLRNF